MAKKTVLFISDPWENFDYDEETTYHLALAAQNLGFICHYAPASRIFFYDGELRVLNPKIVSKGARSLDRDEIKGIKLRDYHSVHWRCDPPVGLETMRLWSLMACTLKKTRMLNSPIALLKWNEKFSALSYPDWSLPSLVSQDTRLRASLAKELAGEHKHIVFKPSGEASSRGVDLVAVESAGRAGDPSDPWPILQRYEPKIMKGEARAFIVDGKVVHSLIKHPLPSEPIMRWSHHARQPKITVAPLHSVQQKMAQTIAKALKKDGVHFATADFIGNRLLEINVTSPGLLHALKESDREALTARYWQTI
jgi:glutathione synthase